MNNLASHYPAWNLVKIDRDSPEPIYVQVQQQIERAIVNRAIPSATRLPPTRILAKELDVSRNTVVSAYERLSADGYILHKVGVGTFVGSHAPERKPNGRHGSGSERRGLRPVSSRGQEISKLGITLERSFGFDLSPLVPAADHFPYETFKTVFRDYWHSIPSTDIVYGEPGGLMRLRRQIAAYLGASRGLVCEPDQIIICGSTLQAVAMSAVLLLDPGDEVVVEDPGHTGEIALLKCFGQKPIHVRCDREGLDLRSGPPRLARARMAIVTPVGQFPFGSNLGPERCQAIVAWAKAHDAWIFEDDYNSEYRWSGAPRPPLASLDRDGRVIYASSFNRALAPGLRLAYVVMPPELVDGFTAAQQMYGAHVPLPLQSVVADFLRRGLFAKHLRRHRAIYQERSAALISELRAKFGDRMDVPEIEAGLHLTVVMQEPCDDVAVSDAALRLGLDVPALSPYCHLPEPMSGFLVGFGNTPSARMPRAVANLAKAVDLVRARTATAG